MMYSHLKKPKKHAPILDISTTDFSLFRANSNWNELGMTSLTQDS